MTHHEQSFAERATAFAENLIWIERDDVAQRKYKRMNIFHVEIVCRDGIGH